MMNKSSNVKHNTKSSLALSVLSLILCIAMLLGTTFAWFTDNVISGRNRITAGNLDVELKHFNTTVTSPETVEDSTDLFGVSKWEPGVVAYENFIVSNEGTLALKYALTLNIFDKNTLDGKDLSEVIKVATYDGELSAGTREGLLATEGLSGFTTLAAFQKSGNLEANGESDTYGVVLYWEPTNHDNDYNVNNGKAVTPLHDGKNELFVEFGVNLVATQKDHESDSFGIDYDEPAQYPVVASATVEAGKDTNIVAYDENNKLAASAKIPVATVLPEGTKKVEMTVDKVALPETIELGEDEEALNLDVNFYLVQSNGSKTKITDFGTQIVNVDLSANIPDNSMLKKVLHTHDGEVNELTPVGSADEVVENTFYYDFTTKMLTIGSRKFSPFTIVVNFPEIIAEKSSEQTKYLSLVEFRDDVNNGESYDGWAVKLVKDVDLTGKDWTDGIGTSSNRFKGHFDGQNHTVSGMEEDGVFYYADHAIIENLVVAGTVTYTGSRTAPVVACIQDCTIRNCVNNANISGGWIAGIVERVSGNSIIENCVNNGTVTQTAGNKVAVGGIAGFVGADDAGSGNVTAVIRNCTNNGTVMRSGTQQQAWQGGIAGYTLANSTIEHCKNTGYINNGSGYLGTVDPQSNGSYRVFSGGILGLVYDGSTTIKECTNIGKVDGYTHAGGIVGSNSGNLTISECYNSGDITSMADGHIVYGSHGEYGSAGGIVGSHDKLTAAKISNCINVGNIDITFNELYVNVNGQNAYGATYGIGKMISGSGTNYVLIDGVYYIATGSTSHIGNGVAKNTYEVYTGTAEDLAAALNSGLTEAFWTISEGTVVPA